MSILTISTNHFRYDEDRIEVMWKMVRLAREVEDKPRVWKLDTPYVQAVATFLGERELENVLCQQFLDADLDWTTTAPALICRKATYPFSLVCG